MDKEIVGVAGEKKISRFLQDGQFDAEIKKYAFVIADGKKVLWLAPVRMSDAVKIENKTHRILEIRIFGQ